MHGFLCAPEDTPFLAAELKSLGHAPQIPAPGWLTSSTDPPSPPSVLVFLRQFLPEVQPVTAGSIRLWAERIVEAVRQHCPVDQPWRLHVVPHYQTVSSTHAGENRCRLVVAAAAEQLARHARGHSKGLQPPGTEPFSTAESLVQLVLTQPDVGWLSVSAAPSPSKQRHRISPFPAGKIPVASDSRAPSRAFSKLIEAELRLGRKISPGEMCVDLGACPGSWTYVALARGAQVVAVDRSPVRADLLRNPRLRFRQGDAFKFRPDDGSPVDWLVCDVIAAPERSVQLVIDWVRARWCRHFVVSIKFKGHDDYGHLDRLKQELPQLTVDFSIARLCANKNEACAFGSVAS